MSGKAHKGKELGKSILADFFCVRELGYFCPTPLAEEELHKQSVRRLGCDDILRCEVSDGGKRVELSSGGVGVVDIEMGEGRSTCTSIETASRQLEGDADAVSLRGTTVPRWVLTSTIHFQRS
jgi:hypothetical protein